MLEKERIACKELCQDVVNNPLPLDKQEAIFRDGKWWCADWWTIEVLKCLFLGEKTYRDELPPRRLRNNGIFSIDNIVADTNNKLNMMDVMRSVNGWSHLLLVCEVGRGIDILLASLVQDWQSIYVYDNNQLVLDEVRRYFSRYLKLPIFIEHMPSNKITIPESRPLLIVGNNMKETEGCQIFEASKEDDIRLILDGKLYKEELCLQKP